MNLHPRGVIIRASKYPVNDTINRLVVYLQEKGATIYARINQQTELHNVGIEIPPLQFILFGSPIVGGKVMAENPVAALDLPLKLIAWEDKHKKVWIGYNDSSYLEKRYTLSPVAGSTLNLDKLISLALKI
jgi:uncharacterized protein (DUF302 family)